MIENAMDVFSFNRSQPTTRQLLPLSKLSLETEKNIVLTNCLLVICSDSPLNIAMEVLLVPASGIQAVKSNAKDLPGVLDEIRNLQSQVVIFEETAIARDQNCLVDIHKLNPGLKIVLVSRDHNRVHVFRGAEVCIESASEFLDIIRS